MAHIERVVVLVDMDCFYCQVEEKLNPSLQGKPIAVVQYNAWRGGGIIAVNYPARDQGVTRHMRGDEARQKCPDIVLARVPQVRGKADLTKYRNAGKEVAGVLQTFTNLLERASVDEAYLDITEEVNKRLEQGLDQIKIEKLANTFVVGTNLKNFINSFSDNSDFSESNIKLAIGGIITEEIRAEILKKTGYKCSAGVAHNKILAKLVCGLHKPNKQTILPQNAVAELYKDLPIKKIKSLGGKFGIVLAEELQITYMGQLVNFSEKELAKKFDEKNAKWLYNIARGIDHESVTVRLVSKSIGCCKKFPGRSALTSEEDVQHWISELATEISERLENDLEENNRRAKQMVVNFTQETNKKDISSSRTHPLQSYEQTKISRGAMDVIRRFCLRADGSYCITFLGISVGNFQDLKNSVDISSIFKNMNQKESPKSKPILQEEKPDNITSFLQNMTEEIKNVNLNSAIKSGKGIMTPENKTLKSFFHSWASSYQKPSLLNTPSSKTVPELSSGEQRSDIAELLPEKTTTIYLNDMKQSEVLIAKPEKINTVMGENQPGGSINNTEPMKIENAKHEPNQIISKSFFLNYFMTEGRHLLKPNTNLMKYAKSLDPTLEFSEEPHLEADPRKMGTKSPYTDTDRQTCAECNRKIPSSEYISHLDYHFALKMVNEEAHLYKKPNVDLKRETENKKIEKTSKEPGPILLLLQKNQKDELDEFISEICAECNQMVRISDFAKHFDKHEKEVVSERKNKEIILGKSKLLNKNLKKSSSDDHFVYNQRNKNDIKGVLTSWSSDALSKTESHKMDLNVYPSCEKWVPNVPSTSKPLDEDADLFSGNFPTENKDFLRPDEDNDFLSPYEDNDEKNSVYSADTEDLNEDISNLIFFEDVFSESDSSQPLFSSQENKFVEGNYIKEKNLYHNLEEPEDKRTHIEQVIINEDDAEPKDSTNSTKSFFLNHLNHERQFVEQNSFNDDESEEPNGNLGDFLTGLRRLPRTLVEDDKEDCPVCHRRISSSEFVSHMDYHFALKMVKDEAHFYQNSSVPATPITEKPLKGCNKKTKHAQNSKRKLTDSKRIDTFLQKTPNEILDDSNSELCAECNKRIKLDETIRHVDYHTAKKLHSELNSPKKVKTALVKSKSKKNKYVMNSKSISNYFKA